jgi:predicted RecB family nuclease
MATIADWAFSRQDEKRIFETFVDFVMKRWEQYPDLHIFHYAPYEPATIKRLTGRYATRSRSPKLGQTSFRSYPILAHCWRRRDQVAQGWFYR